MRREICLRADEESIVEVVGPRTFERARDCLRNHAVVRVEWDDDECALVGTVHGRSGEFYATTAWFEHGEPGELEFMGGECTCPVAIDCKHAAALVLHATSGAGSRAASALPGPRPEPAEPAPVWSQALEALMGRPVGRAQGGLTPMAIELTLAAPVGHHRSGPGARVRLTARVMRAGKKGGWVCGGLAWNRLDQLRAGEGYGPDQVRALSELAMLHRAATSSALPYYGYGYGEEKTIDLGAIGSRALWQVLGDLTAAGVRLVHGSPGLGEVAPLVAASISLDVTATSDGGLQVATVVGVDGQASEAVPVLLTPGGHGAVVVDPAVLTEHPDTPAAWPLRLVSFPSPVAAEVARLCTEQRSVHVPASHVEQFRRQYFPRLAALAQVTSSDDSFVPPQISAPTLVLRADYGDEHELALDWQWGYEIDGVAQRCALEPTDDPFRDPAAEQELLAALEHRRPGVPNRLHGLDTMRFSTEVLPLLRDQPGVAVEISGPTPDYREVGDALHIGVSAAEVAGDTDWFELGVHLRVEGREVPFREVFLALARGDSHLLLPDGGYFSLEKPDLQALRRLIEEARALQEGPDGPLRISRYQAGLWDELVEIGVIEHQSQAWRRQVSGLLDLAALPAPAPPAGLTATLRPYQLAGFQWLTFLWEQRLGGILADDMGLGKTLQALALICHARAADPSAAPFLIVAPTSVVANWPAEAARFAPGLRTVVVSDTLRRSGRDLAEVVAGADLVVTSYTLLRLDVEAWAGREWSGLFLDEAQFVKNHRSNVYAAARRVPAPFKVAITGTPMENNLMELWSLLSIGAPGLFPSPTRFKDHFVRPIEARTGSAGADGVVGQARLAALRRRIRPLMLRRTKDQVAADLPAKQEQVLEIVLHPRHRTIYDRRLQRERQKVLGLLEDMERNRFAIFRSLTVLRQLALHPGLVEDAHADVPCAKIDALVEHMSEVVAGGHRALVFSQFTGFLHLVRDRLSAEGIEFCYLDGKTRRRAQVIEEFKTGTAPLFLISLKAGGFGLNLTEADYCFLLDPWWNPAAETQAVDRTHRIGQDRTVLVYRFISAGTIEAKVRELAARKAALFTDVMGDEGGEAFDRALSADDVRSLFAPT